jgi:hypothetical protein
MARIVGTRATFVSRMFVTHRIARLRLHPFAIFKRILQPNRDSTLPRLSRLGIRLCLGLPGEAAAHREASSIARLVNLRVLAIRQRIDQSKSMLSGSSVETIQQHRVRGSFFLS